MVTFPSFVSETVWNELSRLPYSRQDWEEAWECILNHPKAKGFPEERLWGYLQCCAEAPASSGVALSLKQVLIGFLETFGIE